MSPWHFYRYSDNATIVPFGIATMSPVIDLVSFVSERSRRTIRSRRRRLRCPCQPSCELQEQNPQLCSRMLRAAKSLAAKCQDRASRARVEKRAGAIERCKRAPNLLDADFGPAQGINRTWRKSTGDIDLAKPPKDRPKSSIN